METYDVVIIGAGSGGLVAADFAARLGRKVALVERHRVGGDCTWTGCVPSKALLKVAKVAHAARSAARFGIQVSAPVIAMPAVRAYLRGVIASVYQYETPETLQAKGIEVVMAAARFLDPHTLQAGERTLSAKAFLLCTGAHPAIPEIPGLIETPYLTYEQIFDNDRLPAHLLVIGAGPIGMELAQAYQRLGAQVTLVSDRLLPKDEPEAQAVMRKVFEREGIQFIEGRASEVAREGEQIVVRTNHASVRGDLLLVAAGRTPAVDGLDLDRAGVAYSPKGIPVDEHLHTNVKHIYAAGDVLGGYQFTHLAAWQAFQAVRNILLPGSSRGFSDAVPWVTYTDPEVGHVGLSEEQARRQHGERVVVTRWSMEHTDRALCEDDLDGFIKVVHKADGTLLGATVVNERAGEVISEFVLALNQGLKVANLAGAIHPYPTYSTAVQQLCAAVAVDNLLSGPTGTLLRGLTRLVT